MKKYSLFFLMLSTSLALHSAIFTVTNTNDAGVGSLAEAVTSANATADKDTIEFNIAGAAPHTILGSQLIINNPIHIDGDSQPANGYTGAKKKIIYSRQTGGINTGFMLLGNNSTIKNIQFNNWVFAIYAISIDGFNLEENAFIYEVTGGVMSMRIDGCDNGFVRNNLFSKEEKDGPCVGFDVTYHIAPFVCSNVEVTGNEVCKSTTGAAILVRDTQNSIFQGNQLNGGPTDCNVQADEGMAFLRGSVDNQVGGNLAGEANTILGFSDDGVLVGDSSKRILIKFNEFQCVTGSAITLNTNSQNSKVAPEITFADAGSVIGTADPGDIVAVYRSADNAVLVCGGPTIPQSELYYGEVTADAGGNWTLIGTFEGFITATSTDASNNTSVFTDIYDTGIGFTNATSTCFSGVLTVHTLALQAKYHSSTGTLLSWNRLEEFTSSSVQIQRSTDLERWIQIGRLHAREQLNFTDLYPPAGHIYYRIQQQNEDGSTVLSSIVSVFIDRREWTDLQLFPNPATDQLTIIPQDHAFLMEETTIEIFSLEGKRMLMDKIEEVSSTHKIKIDHLPKGVYLLRISGNTQRLQQKISIL
ncbi:MAG: T9SS type A sorting domain-containing protein [Bacteroidota bacterium]